MARQIITKLTDDLDGSDADESVTFGLDGIQYEIDLSAKNAAKLRASLAPYLASGTKAGRVATAATSTGGRVRGSAAADKEQNKAIREWAISEGREVSARGRIAQGIVDEFHARKAPRGTAAANPFTAG